MSRNRKKIKSRAVKTAAVMGALVLAALPVIPSIGELGFGTISVSAAYEETAKVTTVDFKQLEKGTVNIQGNTGTISDENWTVDATKTNAKLYSRGDGGHDAQFNAGTKISIPVSGKGTIKIVANSGYHYYTVNGGEVDNDTYEYTYDVADATDKTVDIIATKDSYIYSIQKTENSYKSDKPNKSTFTYDLNNYKVTSKTYDFTTDKKETYSVGSNIADKGIILLKGSCKNDGQLRFANGVELLIPIKDETTAIRYTLTTGSPGDTRIAYFGSKNSGYSIGTKSDSPYDIDDITDMIVDKDGNKYTEGSGQKYIKIISAGDIKYRTLTIDEFNPVNIVNVSGTVPNGIKQVVFGKDGKKYIADVIDGKYSIDLKRIKGDTTYTVSVISDDYIVNPDENTLTLLGNDATATKDISLVEAEKVDISGKIKGLDNSMLKGELTARLVPTDPAFSTIELKLIKNSDGTYSFDKTAILEGYEYSVELENADDFEITNKINLVESTDSLVIEATKKTLNTVTGDFVTSDDGKSDITEITFTNMETPDYKYTFDVNSGTYTAKLRAGEYETSVKSANGKYTAYDHVSVSDSAVSNDVYLKAPVDNSAVEYQAEVKVGEGQQFSKIADAISYISRMTRTEDQRVTVLLTEESYREQVVIDTPNVTIKSARDEGSTITWYYGVGYYYYSASSSTDGRNGSYYDEALAVDKYYKNMVDQNPGHWGATVNLFSGAKGFKADGITFENSFNRYKTSEEVNDGVGVGTKNSKVDRSDSQTDVKAYLSKERSCVLYIQADDTEYNNCKLLSSQDTLYTGDGTETSYFSNCVIEGNTDYICGDGNAVFDNCTLSMYGYSDKAAIDSVIVANKNKAADGYLFNNCKIINTTYEGIQKTTSLYLARSWSKGCKDTFINTELEDGMDIMPFGFYNMGEDPKKLTSISVKDSTMREYNTHRTDGTLVSTEGRAIGTILLGKEEADTFTVSKFLGDFNATYYYADYTKVDEAIAAADKLNADDYIDFSEVVKAKEAVVRNLGKQDQSKVDSMADAINNAISSLVKVSSGVDTGKDAPSVEVKESVSDLIDKVLSDDLKKDAEGKDVKIVLSVNKDTGVSEEDKKAVEEKLAEFSSGKKAGMYLDIDLNVVIGNGNISVAETKKPIAIEVSVPDELINTDANKTRKYSVLRVHNGKVDVLDVTYDENTKKLSFESDVFSTYVLVYEDTVKNPTTENPTTENPSSENPAQENPTTEAPSADEPATEAPAGTEIKDGDKSAQTGDKSPIAVLVSLLGLSGLGIFASTKKKRV